MVLLGRRGVQRLGLGHNSLLDSDVLVYGSPFLTIVLNLLAPILKLN
jgi:hypothetical protein